MQAEIIAIGDELLSGETVDTNSSYLDGLLEGWGWQVIRHVTVPDELEAIAAAYREASTRAQLILSTGGLGPTQDDLTLEGLSLALGCRLVRHEATIEAIKRRFAAFGREMTPNNERQAMVPELGEVLENQAGTAPGFTAQLGGATVFLMPGVPREVRWLMQHQIGPRIVRGAAPPVRRTVKVMGIGESRLEHDIRAVVARHPEVRFGYRTQGAENHVKLLAHGADAEARLAAIELELKEALGARVFGKDRDELASVLVEGLIARGETLALAESCTGGLAGRLVTDVPGASTCFLGAIVAYANEAKTALLGVDAATIAAHGAVSEAVARAMAEGARARLGSTWAASTTGIAGPGGGSDEKPVGTVWLAVAGPAGTEARRVVLPGDREQVRLGAAKLALDLVRVRLGQH
jgi:nicotinamide-nucleotide amidase